MTTATSSPRERAPRSAAANAEIGSLLKAIENIVEEERARLMSAEAVLHCAAIAMEGDEGQTDKPHYPSVIDLARSLIAQSISQLLRLKPLLERIREQGSHGVKEHTSSYLH